MDIVGSGLLDNIDDVDDDELPGITGIMFCQIGTAVNGMEQQAQTHRSAFTQDRSDTSQLANVRSLASNATAPTPQHFTYYDVILSQAKSGINRNWSLLDSQPTRDLFINAMYLLNIREAPNVRVLHAHCNAGVAIVKLIGTLPGYGAVWYHPEGIATVLSLARVRKLNKVTYDSTSGQGFIVHSSNRHTFKETERPIYAYDMRKLKNGAHLLANIATIGKDEGQGIRVEEENKKKYTDRDVKRADCAR